jgi:hypothetical protein
LLVIMIITSTIVIVVFKLSQCFPSAAARLLVRDYM